MLGPLDLIYVCDNRFMVTNSTGSIAEVEYRVDVYRNGVFLTAQTNDGVYTNSRSLPGANQYTYRVCQTGTTVCSNNATVTFP